MSNNKLPKVLIITGGLLSFTEKSWLKAIKRQVTAMRASSGAWLDVQIKMLAMEEIIAMNRYQRSRGFRQSPHYPVVQQFFDTDLNFNTPELTEVVIMTLLAQQGLQYEVITYVELCNSAELRERLLDECDCVFASTTLLRDLSELTPLIALIHRPNNHIVLGGALVNILHEKWQKIEGVDVIAVGYGEYLVPSLVDWIRSGYTHLQPPTTGRLVNRDGTSILYSGVPDSKNLDDLVSPDWQLAARYHGRSFEMVYYESVRGCPYRCAFCNYPFVFDDQVFRLKSAEKIAADWQLYAENGVRFVTCLDSLFTIPKKRVRKLCRLLIKRKVNIKWICYARPDDLADIDLCRLLKEAGCVQVQIGIESGDQGQLNNMNKRCTVAQNAAALQNCRKVGITSVITMMIGFPGETVESIQRSYRFLCENPPDFFYTAPFNARVEHVPILSRENRQKFSIQLANDGHSSQPYWRHKTMCSSEVGQHWMWFNQQLMLNRISLSAGLFFKGILGFQPQQRKDLLDFQVAAMQGQHKMRHLFGYIHRWSQYRLEQDVAAQLV